MPGKKLYIALSLVFIGIIGIPALQTLLRFLPEKPLNGVTPDKPLPPLTFSNWWHFRYQPELNARVEQNFGLRPAFVRSYNQIEYSLFRQPHGSGVVIGKEGYLFEEWFLTAYSGQDYIGEARAGSVIRHLRQIRHWFNLRNQELAVVIAPGKARFYPEYIPERYTDSLTETNYTRLAAGIRKAGIPLLDYNPWFQSLKDTCSCPLFPKTGTHWSHYGARISMDTLSGFIASALSRRLPDISVTSTFPVDSVVYPDNDLERLMNLWFPLGRNPLCYPEIGSADPSGYDLPDGIVIGDSFFWEMFNAGLTGRIFNRLNYWYYNSTVYPESFVDSLHTDKLRFPDAFADTDIIILMVNPSNIQNIGWGFLERAVRELYNPVWQQEYDKMVREYIQAIRNTPEWEAQVIRQAKDQGVPLDTMMMRNARYMVEEYLKEHDLF